MNKTFLINNQKLTEKSYSIFIMCLVIIWYLVYSKITRIKYLCFLTVKFNVEIYCYLVILDIRLSNNNKKILSPQIYSLFLIENPINKLSFYDSQN